MKRVRDKVAQNKCVYEAFTRLLHKGGTIEMAAVSNGILKAINEVRSARLH